ncbi:MAG: dynamin family protein, partial [Trichodesmium sp. St5_bin8]|nr:dynamin family protein [Trichodesmium sp. St5_bin8]
MQNQNTGFNLEVTKIRHGFADKLQETEKIIGDFENQAIVQGASGQLELSAVRKSLRNEIGKLKNGKFRFLIIGDFNRGKSTILNAFFEKSLLPMGVTATTAIPTFVK